MKKGDRVYANDTGKEGVIIGTDADGSGSTVLFDDGEQTWIENWQLSRINVCRQCGRRYDPRESDADRRDLFCCRACEMGF